MKYELFVVAIVKGLVEINDPYTHFGSTMAFRWWKSQAVEAGLITEDKKLTDAGKKAYETNRWVELPSGRATGWQPKPQHNIKD
jgi:hypothetical protein